MLLFFQDKNEAWLNLNHSVPLLRELGVPADAAVTVNSGSHGNGSYYHLLHSSAGNQKVGGSSSALSISGVSDKMPFQTKISVFFSGAPALQLNADGRWLPKCSCYCL